MLLGVSNDSRNNASLLIHQRMKMSVPHSHKLLIALHPLGIKKPRESGG